MISRFYKSSRLLKEKRSPAERKLLQEIRSLNVLNLDETLWEELGVSR
jgi:hypothetical protein